MTLADFLGLVAAVIAGAMAICQAYLTGFKDRGFPGAPFAVRGAVLFLGIALWVRAGVIYPAAELRSLRYPQGHHVGWAEASVYVAFAFMLMLTFVHYFVSAHRWYAEGKELKVDRRDAPTVKSLPEQVTERLREELPAALDSANARLLDRMTQNEPVPSYRMDPHSIE